MFQLGKIIAKKNRVTDLLLHLLNYIPINIKMQLKQKNKATSTRVI